MRRYLEVINSNRGKIKLLKAEFERDLRYTKRGRRGTGVDWVRRKFGKLTSRGLIVQMNDVVQMKSRQFRDAKTRDAINQNR